MTSVFPSYNTPTAAKAVFLRKKAPESSGALNVNMVRQARFEPATHGLEGRCSIQLSY